MHMIFMKKIIYNYEKIYNLILLFLNMAGAKKCFYLTVQKTLNIAIRAWRVLNCDNKFKKTDMSLGRSFSGRKTLFHTLPQKLRASMTVEASLALPIFFMALFTVLYLFQVCLLQQQIRCAMYEAAQEQALTAHVTEDGGGISELSSFGLDTALGELSVQSALNDEGILDLVVGGRAGVICTQIDGDKNYVNLQSTCTLKLPLAFCNIGVYVMRDEVHVRKWTGYDPAGSSSCEGDEEMVYITASGVAYHKDRECSYLNPSIKKTSVSAAKESRNSSGHKYYACPLCAKGEILGDVYITTYGENYHTSVNCSGLKRTISCVTLSEAKEAGKHPCSKCGG